MPQDFSAPITWIAYWPVLIGVWVAYRGIRYWVTNRIRGLSLLETVLLFVVIVGGGGLTAAANLSGGLGRSLGLDDPADIWTVTGNSYTYTQTLDAEVAAEGPESIVEVYNLYGDVEIRSRPGTQLSLVAKKIIRASSQEEADRLNGEFQFQVQPGTKRTVVESILDNDGSRHAPREWFRSNLTLWVPPDTRARVTNRWGNVVVGSGLSVETDVQHGEVINEFR